MFPQSHQEIARAHHADLLREATQERLAALVREGAAERLPLVGRGAFRWAKSVTRRPVVRTA